MQSISLGRVSQACQLAHALEASGASPERLLRQLNLPCWHHCDPDGLLPSHQLYRIAARFSKVSGIPAFGVRAMELTPISEMSGLGAAIAAEATLFRALHAAIELIPRYGTSKRWWLTEAGDDVWMLRGAGVRFDEGENIMVQHNLAGLVQIVRIAAGPDWRPPRVRVQAPGTASLDTTEMFSRSRILPDPTWSGIAVPKALLPLPTATSARVVRQRCHRWLPKPPEPGDFAGSVRAVITTLLGEGYPEIETTAEILGLRVRTLQRHLAVRGVMYRGLVDQARFEAARNLLGRSEASITEIGYDLGYQDAAHFTRAFKRWAGVSPSVFRRTAAVPTSANGARSDV